MRLVLPKPELCVFIDVESTTWHETLLIGIFHVAYGYRHLYRGRRKRGIPPKWVRNWFDNITGSKNVEVLVTYSGLGHDVDAVRKDPGVDLLGEYDLRHFDLYHAAEVLADASLISRKGLKALERHFKIFRPLAVRMERSPIYHLHKIAVSEEEDGETSPEQALDKLLTYNYFDTVNLYYLLVRLVELYGRVLDSGELDKL